jgi:hypothetical protein
VAGTCGYGEGLLGSINAGNFLTSCKVYWLVRSEERRVGKECGSSGRTRWWT